jgi:hypothetical protein
VAFKVLRICFSILAALALAFACVVAVEFFSSIVHPLPLVIFAGIRTANSPSNAPVNTRTRESGTLWTRSEGNK